MFSRSLCFLSSRKCALAHGNKKLCRSGRSGRSDA
nr:MAG TPA: hypothetical protein [Bacteriophage sp.]